MNSSFIKDKEILISTYNYKFIINKNYSSFLKNIKIINKKSIFLTGIPLEIEIEELYNQKYLGQYGEVKSIVKSKLKNSKHKYKQKTFSIFVTYNSKWSCAIAINCLNNFYFKSKEMKCSFASNKICQDKLFHNICNKRGCYFYHGLINKSNSIIKILDNTNLKIIELYNEKSIDVLKKNISKILNKFSNIDQNSTIFPSIQNFLINFKNKLNNKNLSTDINSKKNIENFLVSFKKLNN